jgi:C_GCAxxG_C_C family probable redox protein
MNNIEREEKAVNFKRNGYNCCQAVVKALSDLTNVGEDTLSELSSGFGAGMGGMEATCGAVIGAAMITGMIKGKGSAATTREILKKFNEYSGATLCKDLKGRDTGVAVCACDDCVRNAVRAFNEVVKM